jgi:sec-independent protein translocase protein TatC
MPNDRDLFVEEQSMVTMSFGEHIEELRARLILALTGLFVGVLVMFIPPLNLGQRIMTQMVEPAQRALEEFYKKEAAERAAAAEKAGAVSASTTAIVAADALIGELRRLAPDLKLPEPSTVRGQVMKFPIQFSESGMIGIVQESARKISAVISLAPLETMTIFFLVCLVAGLVLSSPWVFYQIWAFVAAGLYRHERQYVMKFLPFSLGLFLSGVFLCFFYVLPITLNFLLEFNVWLGIEPTLRLADWMSFATILPLIFGICFQTPLVMLFLSLIGIFTANDFRSKRKVAILVLVIVGAIITPTQDPFSMLLLAVPMIVLYELGIWLVQGRERKTALEMGD